MPQLRITRAGIKTVARFIVARAASGTISLIIHNNAEPEGFKEVASVHIGAFVIGEFVGDAMKPYVDAQIDSAADALESAKKKYKELTES